MESRELRVIKLDRNIVNNYSSHLAVLNSDWSTISIYLRVNIFSLFVPQGHFYYNKIINIVNLFIVALTTDLYNPNLQIYPNATNIIWIIWISLVDLDYFCG